MPPQVTPSVSIIIPVYNTGVLLEDCLNSVIGQSLREIEIICVDDCSTDGSPARLESHAKRDARVRVMRKERSEGPSAARNLGMETATGKYLLFVDADDWIDKELCKKVCQAAEESQAGLVLFDYATERGRSGKSRVAQQSVLAGLDPSDKRALLAAPAFSWSKLIRVALIRSLGISFPVGISYSEDALVHWRLVLGIEDIALLPEPLYHYRQHSDSITCVRGNRLADRILVYDQIGEYLKRESLYQIYHEPFLTQQLGAFYGVYDRIEQRSRRDVVAMIRQRMTDEHWRFVADGQLPRPVRDFFLALQGKTAAKFRRSIWLSARWCHRGFRKAGRAGGLRSA